MAKEIMTIKKLIIYGSIVLSLLIGWGVIYALIDENREYSIGRWPQRWGWIGLNIEGIGEHRSTSINWITGYNFSENFVYGKTPISWFVTDTQNYKEIEFRRESSFKNYLRKNNIEFKKLIDAPIFKIPDLFYGYHLKGTGDKRTILYLEKLNTTEYETNITKIGLTDNYIIGENKKGWFYVHMPTDKKQFTKSIDELATILGFNKDELLQKVMDVPNYAKYKLPFKNYTITARMRSGNAWGLYIKGKPYKTSYKPVVRFFEYYRKKKGYIYGKSTTDFFILNIQAKNCEYFRYKENWLKELDKLNLPNKRFNMIDARRIKQEPWVEEERYKTYAD